MSDLEDTVPLPVQKVKRSTGHVVVVPMRPGQSIYIRGPRGLESVPPPLRTDPNVRWYLPPGAKIRMASREERKQAFMKWFFGIQVGPHPTLEPWLELNRRKTS